MLDKLPIIEQPAEEPAPSKVTGDVVLEAATEAQDSLLEQVRL